MFTHPPAPRAAPAPAAAPPRLNFFTLALLKPRQRAVSSHLRLHPPSPSERPRIVFRRLWFRRLDSGLSSWPGPGLGRCDSPLPVIDLAPASRHRPADIERPPIQVSASAGPAPIEAGRGGGAEKCISMITFPFPFCQCELIFPGAGGRREGRVPSLIRCHLRRESMRKKALIASCCCARVCLFFPGQDERALPGSPAAALMYNQTLRS